jgi:beta-glucosidase/6-phospho-beta-glucosidase/beta-galactosidase
VRPVHRSHRASARGLLSGIESTFQPGFGSDVAESTGHALQWRSDVDAMLATGAPRLRYPLRWHRIEQSPGVFDWSEPDAILGYLHDRGADPIVDLLHHTSYPAWIDDGFRDRRFPAAFVRYAEAAARRYPWLRSYTLFNEPFATLFLCGHEALWPPYDSGIAGFVGLLRRVLPAISTASQCWSDLLPEARHIWVDTCEHHGAAAEDYAYAELANDRRHIALDLALGHDLREDRPFLRKLIEAGGQDLLGLDAVRVDVLGLDYYCHSEWWYDDLGAHAPSPHPIGFAALCEQYASRYGLPMMLAETNIRGLPTDRASWLRYMLEQYAMARDSGIDLVGFCWFPFVGSCDWDSLLARPARRADPVGVLDLGTGLRRQRTAFTDVWELAAAGVPLHRLPAYRFQSPCAEQLAGFTAQMAHWPWEDPPWDAFVPPVPVHLSAVGVTDPFTQGGSHA